LLQCFPNFTGQFVIGAFAQHGVVGGAQRDAGFNQGFDHKADRLILGAASGGDGEVQSFNDAGVGGGHLLCDGVAGLPACVHIVAHRVTLHKGRHEKAPRVRGVSGGSKGEVQAGQLFTGPLEVFGVHVADAAGINVLDGLAAHPACENVIGIGALVVLDLQVCELTGAGLFLEYQQCKDLAGNNLRAGHCADLPSAAHLIEQGFGDVGH
jgi:hypothetical protein